MELDELGLWKGSLYPVHGLLEHNIKDLSEFLCLYKHMHVVFLRMVTVSGTTGLER